MGTLALRRGKGVFKSHDSCFIFICRTHSTSESWLWRQQVCGYRAARGNLSAYEFREKTKSHQTVRNLCWESRAIYHDRLQSAAGSIVAEGAGAWISSADCAAVLQRGEKRPHGSNSSGLTTARTPCQQ